MAAPPDIDEEEEIEEIRKISWKKLLAIVVGVGIVAGVGVYFVVFANQPPVAAFTYSAIDKKLTVSADSSRDPDGRIVSYVWDWGDDKTDAGIRKAHTYAAEGEYTVTLTVRDDKNAAASRSEAVKMVIKPTADFDVDVDRMSISVDGSLSYSTTGGNITSWSWDFGDGTSETGVRASHTYTSQDRYAVTLTVVDEAGRVGNVSRYVSPADTTVDVKISKAHTAACPFETYWSWRNGTYGDQIVLNQLPYCVDYYPWVLFTASGDINPSFLYTVYHRVSKVRNHPGYTLLDPVILPVNNSAVVPAPSSKIEFDISFEYMGEEWKQRLNGTPYDPNSGLLGDGFHTLMRGNITMDLTMSKRIFGVPVASTPTEAQAWWYRNTGPPRKPLAVENFTARWLEIQGNGKYNIWEGFEWELVPDIVDLSATVGADGTTRIQIWWEIYGMDALWMRWWYWGRANYTDAVRKPYGAVPPEGWAPEELCWCEHATMVGNITGYSSQASAGSLNLDYSSDAGYQWMAWANPGPDGTWNTDDDLPAWVYEPIYLDYVPSAYSPSPGAGKYYTSELTWWEGKTMIHAAPGSYNYGKPYEYMLAATRYIFKPGYTLTIRLPQGDVPWFDAYRSTWDRVRLIGNYKITYAPITLRYVLPDGNYFLWDPRTKVLSFAGPYDYGGRTDLPVLPEPWVEMQPEAVG